jgi:protein-S-isoprenylcysteine O-methyltransferase Ste14
MKTKHLLIEILPRLFWLIQLVILGVIAVQNGFILRVSGVAVAGGSLLALLGCFFLVWSFVVLAKAMITKELIRKGPYKYVRHPIYSSMYLLLIGIGILFFDKAWFIVLLVFIPIWILISLAEERQMTDLYPEEYKNYKSSTKMFIPKLV